MEMNDFTATWMHHHQFTETNAHGLLKNEGMAKVIALSQFPFPQCSHLVLHMPNIKTLADIPTTQMASGDCVVGMLPAGSWIKAHKF